ncbi:MAG: transglycosylase family protein [Solirubrobacteraceae bacterium]
MPVSAEAQAQAPAPSPGQNITGGQPPTDLAHAAKVPLIKRYLRLEARRQSLKDERLTVRERDKLGARLSRLTPERLRAEVREVRREVRKLRRKVERERHGGAPNIPIPAALKAIAECESGGNPRAISAGGTYRGKYQFDVGTWASVGGDGDPAAASETEQDRRAALLYRRAGATPWPVCGR